MKSLRLALCACGLLLVTGCASRSSGLSDEAKRQRAQAYEYVRTVDSHIPQRVARGNEAEYNSGSSPVTVIKGQQAQDMLRPRGNPRF